MIPRISVVVITKNEEKNIEPCLKSITNVDYPMENIEVIVVDNSDDLTPDIVKSYNGVKLVPTSQNGFAKPRNIGIANAKNELIAFTDADCEVPKRWLKKLIIPFKDKRVAGVGGNAYPPKGTSYLGRCIAALGIPAGGSIGLDACIKKVGEGVSNLVTCNAIFRKKVLEELGGFDESLRFGGEDTNLSKRILDKGYIMKYVPDSFVLHKTRNTFIDFVKWQYRRGIADLYLYKHSFLRLLLNPFSFLSILGAIFIFIFLAYYSISYSISFFLILFFLLLSIMLTTKRYRLLIRRRKRAGMAMLSILTVVPILFYIRRLVINTAELKVMLFGTK